MSRADLYDVELKGTWERPRTSREDIQFMRRALRGSGGQSGINGSFSARRGTRGLVEETRVGTFEALVGGVFATNRTDAKRRALQLLKYHVKDITCRVPKLKVDLDKSRTKCVDAPYDWLTDTNFRSGR